MGILRDNIFVIDTGYSGPQTVGVQITEHHAPTDASVQILRDMEDAARKQVDLAVHVGNTTFECVVHRHVDAMSDCVVLRAIFKLNGVQRTAEHRFRSTDADQMAVISQAMRDLRDKIATVIATEMIHSALDSGCLGSRYLK